MNTLLIPSNRRMDDAEFIVDELSNDDDEIIQLGLECNVEIKEESWD